MMNNIYELSGKTAIITGASSGLGEQFARCLSSAGVRVILLARRIEKLELLANELDNALPLKVDISDKQSVLDCFEMLSSMNETVDICINNSGIALPTPIFSDDESDYFENTIQTNLTGTWYITKSVANHMKINKTPGTIINIASVNGRAVPVKEGAAYSVSKAAVIHLTKTLVGELSPHNIRINCISPGWFKTPMNPPNVEKYTQRTPYGEIAEPGDLDGLILYLASNKLSKYVTGSCFTIDGGMSWGGIAL